MGLLWIFLILSLLFLILSWWRRRPNWYVRYASGDRSVLMSLDDAVQAARMFGGVVQYRDDADYADFGDQW